MVRFAYVLGVIGAAALVACSFLVDMSNLSADPSGGAPGLEAGVDGAVDGAVDGGSDAGSFCLGLSPAPALCDDFDEPQTAFAWTTDVDPIGTLGLDDAGATSAPTSLRSTMANPTSAPCKYAYEYVVPSIAFPTRVRFAYSMRIGHLGAAGGVPSGYAPGELHVSGAGNAGKCGYYITVGGAAAAFNVEGVASATFPLSQPVPPNKWVRFELTIDTAGKAGLTMDGAPVLASATIPAACKFGVVTNVAVGLLCHLVGAGDADLHIDDVVVRTD